MYIYMCVCVCVCAYVCACVLMDFTLLEVVDPVTQSWEDAVCLVMMSCLSWDAFTKI